MSNSSEKDRVDPFIINQLRQIVKIIGAKRAIEAIIALKMV